MSTTLVPRQTSRNQQPTQAASYVNLIHCNLVTYQLPCVVVGRVSHIASQATLLSLSVHEQLTTTNLGEPLDWTNLKSVN